MESFKPVQQACTLSRAKAAPACCVCMCEVGGIWKGADQSTLLPVGGLLTLVLEPQVHHVVTVLPDMWCVCFEAYSAAECLLRFAWSLPQAFDVSCYAL